MTTAVLRMAAIFCPVLAVITPLAKLTTPDAVLVSWQQVIGLVLLSAILWGIPGVRRRVLAT